MTDELQRSTQRAWQQTGDLEQEAALLAGRLRAGTVRPDLLRLAAVLGHEPAAMAVGEPGLAVRSGGLHAWIQRLAPWGVGVTARAALVATRRALEGLPADVRTGELGASIDAALRVTEQRLEGRTSGAGTDVEDVRPDVLHAARRVSEAAWSVARAARLAQGATLLRDSRRLDERAADQAGRAVQAAAAVVPQDVLITAIQQALLPLILSNQPPEAIRYREPPPPVVHDPSPLATRSSPVLHPGEEAAWQATRAFATTEESWHGGPMFGADVLLPGPGSERRFREIWSALFDDEALMGPFEDHGLTTLETTVPWPSGDDFGSADVPVPGRYGALRVEGHGFALARPGVSVRRATNEVRARLWVPPRSIGEIVGDSTPFMRWSRPVQPEAPVQALHDAVLGWVLRLRERLPIVYAEVREEAWPSVGQDARDRLPAGAVVVLRALSSVGQPIDDLFNAVTT